MTAKAATAEATAQLAPVEQINMTPERALEIVDAYALQQRFSWWLLGEAFNTITKLEYWQGYLPFSDAQEKYHSFEDFCNRRLQSARSTAYAVMKLRDELAVLKPEDAQRISRANAGWLVKLKQRLGESKWCNPSTIEKAISMHEDDFKEWCNSKLPGCAKEEEQERFTIKLDKSLKKLHVKAFTIAEWQMTTQGEDPMQNAPSEQEVYEHLLSFYLNSQSENHAKGISNLVAYEQRSKSKKKKVAVN